MKFNKYQPCDFRKPNGYKGKKNKISFNIQLNECSNRYWILIKDIITNIDFNSHWRDITFEKENIEDAFSFCEELADYYKKHRITQVSNCDSRIDDFLDTIDI